MKSLNSLAISPPKTRSSMSYCLPNTSGRENIFYSFDRMILLRVLSLVGWWVVCTQPVLHVIKPVTKSFGLTLTSAKGLSDGAHTL